MTVSEAYHDKPFAMLNWHRNWCEKQSMYPFCFMLDMRRDIKRTWPNCPHREMCFMAFINSDATAEKGCSK